MGHDADSLAGEGEDEEASSVADAAGVAGVAGAERRLRIRAGRPGCAGPAAHESGEEAGHDVAAVVFEGNRWHRNADISGEQVDQRVDIAGLPYANELCDERTLGP